MSISKAEVIKVGKLARLELEDEAIDKLAVQIGQILEYVDTLNRADTDNINPTSHAITLSNAFRADREKEHLGEKMNFANAPQSEEGSYIVPKVIES